LAVRAKMTFRDSGRAFWAVRMARQMTGSCISNAKRVSLNGVRGSAQREGEPVLPA